MAHCTEYKYKQKDPLERTTIASKGSFSQTCQVGTFFTNREPLKGSFARCPSLYTPLSWLE